MRELPKAASAAERAAAKWSQSTQEAGRSSEEFSRRVRKTIADLEFERQQLARSATERARYATLRRAGVAEASAEGQAILASVKALEAQKAALGQTSLGARALGGAMSHLKGLIAGLGIAFVVDKLIEMAARAFEAASGMQELAEQVGLSAKTFQSLLFAATQNGVKTEQLETGLAKFSQKMGEAAEGSKEMIEALTKLGVKNLDTAGKLRPTEDLLVDVAKAITSIDDPARRSAAAVDFFGKAGTRMLPLLTEIAKGTGSMTDAAKDFGAVISDETIAKLDKLADSMAAGALRTRAWAAELLAAAVDIGEKFVALGQGVIMGMTRMFKSLVDDVDNWLSPIGDKIGQVGASAAAMFIEAFSSLPDTLSQLFTNAWEAVRVATAKGVNEITSLLPDWMGGKTNLDTTPRGVGPVGAGVGERIAAAGEKAAADMAARQEAAKQAQFSQSRTRMRATSTMGDLKPPTTIGAGTSAVKDSGKEAENAAKKYDELIASLTQTAAAQTKMTEAAGQGQVAFEQQKATLDAQEKLLGIYGLKLGYTAEQLTKVRDLLLSIAQGKAAESFQVATTELNNQNVILQKQIELMNERPEIQAREIALIKAKQEAEKGGTAITADMTEARRKAIEQNETLKNQAEELKKANELWMEPVKSALQSIQSTAADAFENMLTSGKVSFEELGNVFKKTITRMIAEFLALATVRPVMSVLVNAVSPGMAQQMGLGTGNIGGGAGGGGMLGGLGGDIGSFLSKPLFGGGENFGPPMEGQSFASLGSSGGLSVGGALGGLASIGMGAFQMFGGKGGAGSMLGGGLGIAGGLTSMLGPMLGLGAAAGPIGLGIGLLGSLLPSLLGGESKPTITNQGYGQLSYGGGGFGTSGGAWGPNADMNSLTGPLGGVGKSMDAVFKAFGGVKEAGKVWGLALQSFSQQYGDGSSFSNQTSFLVDPSGNKQQWGMGSNDKDVGMASAAVKATVMSILDGAVGDITENMKRALSHVNWDEGFEGLSTTVTEVMAFDDAIKKFGKTATQAGDALQAIDDQMASLYTTASKYGLDTQVLDTEKTRLRTKVGADFTDVIARELMDPLTLALTQIGDERTAMVRENSALMGVEGYLDQINNIEAIYAKKRAKIIDDYNAEALAKQKALNAELAGAALASLNTIQGLIKELTPGGALSGLDPASQLAGLRGTADASLAQALADPTNATLVDNAVADQRAFIDFNKSFTGGSTDYQADVQNRLGALQGLQAGVVTAAMNKVSDTVTHSYLAQILDAVQNDRTNVEKVMSLLARYLANPNQAAA